MVDERRMKDALAALERQEAPNFSAIAREFNLDRTTLSRRWNGQTTSRAEANSQYR